MLASEQPASGGLTVSTIAVIAGTLTGEQNARDQSLIKICVMTCSFRLPLTFDSPFVHFAIPSAGQTETQGHHKYRRRQS